MSALLLPAWVALAFILGAIPFGVVIAKLGKGIDPGRAAATRAPPMWRVCAACPSES